MHNSIQYGIVLHIEKVRHFLSGPAVSRSFPLDSVGLVVCKRPKHRIFCRGDEERRRNYIMPNPTWPLEKRRRAAAAIRYAMRKNRGMTKEKLLAIAEKAIGEPVPTDSIPALLASVHVRKVGNSYILNRKRGRRPNPKVEEGSPTPELAEVLLRSDEATIELDGALYVTVEQDDGQTILRRLPIARFLFFVRDQLAAITNR